jgi:hypothetical protein
LTISYQGNYGIAKTGGEIMNGAINKTPYTTQLFMAATAIAVARQLKSSVAN